jgi:hypothetical protein
MSSSSKSKTKRGIVVKKKTSKVEDDKQKETNDEDEEEETNIEKEIKTWAASRGLGRGIRTLTTTVAIETVIVANPKFDVLKYTKDASRCLGILSTDATLFANYISTQDIHLDSLTSDFGEYPFYRSCFDVSVGITNNVDSGVLNAFKHYCENTGYVPRRDLLAVYELNRRPRDAIIQYEIRPAMKRHMKYLATSKLLDYLTLRNEQVLWSASNEENFKETIKYLARKMREHLLCGVAMDERLIPSLLKLLDKWSLPATLLDACLQVAEEIRPFVDKLIEANRKPCDSHFLSYLRGVQYERSTVVKMARYIGKAMNDVRNRKIQACKEVTEVQPYVRKSSYWEGVTKHHAGYKAYLQSSFNTSTYEPLREWCNHPQTFKGKMSSQEIQLFKQLYQHVVERRKQLFTLQDENPGYMLLGSSFTLLPICSLSRAFVNIDHDSLNVWYRHCLKEQNETKIKPLEQRNWWAGCFDPYRSETVTRESNSPRSTSFRKVRRQAHTKVHVRYLSRSRDMMLNDRLYEAARDNKDTYVPLFVSNIRSDGIQVKLLLKTLSECRPTAKNVALLVNKGYEDVKNTKKKLDIFRDYRGVYDESHVKKLTKKQLSLLESSDINVQLSAIDPGTDKTATWVRSDISSNPLELPEDTSKFGAMKTSHYRVLNLTHNAERQETKRRESNLDYQEAISSLSQERLNDDTELFESYITTRNKYHFILEDEVLTDDRARLRFIRFRAQQRALRFLVRQITTRTLTYADVKSDKRMEVKAKKCPEQAGDIHKRLQLRRKLREQLGRLRFHIVFFGKGIFGHGRTGSCPRKKLIKKLADVAVVVLIDEFRTSKMCCGNCGCEAHQIKGSRVLRCQSGKLNTEGVSPAPTNQCQLWNTKENKPFEIDRDRNASVNLFNIGRGLLFDGKRPAFLTRSPEDKEDDLVG